MPSTHVSPARWIFLAMNDQHASPTIDVAEMTVEQAQAGFCQRRLHGESLTQAFLDRIATYNPRTTRSCS